MKQKKYLLPESEIPTHYFNIQAVMPNKPLPFLNPATKEPLKPEDLYPVFVEECARQELNQTDEWIPIPEPVREQYAFYRCTPLVRAYELEEALGTPAHIFFKNESVSPAGSHKLNSALAQAYYAKQEGITNITTETGAGQWGGALSYAAKKFGLGCAISEAMELALTTPNCKYTLGSVLNHVCMHQTVIGLEAEKQMALTGEYPDIVIGCFGGGSNFSGIAFPFLRHNIKDGKKTRFIAAEPASCPKLTRGKFEYDFADEAGMTPLLPMFTLGHTFKPATIHAGGLRYHGAGVILSQLMKDGYMEAVDLEQTETFKAGILFAQTEGIIPAPESCHAIAATIREALKCKETGEAKTILFNLSGHGFVDMSAYDQYISGELQDYKLTDAELAKYIQSADVLNQ